MTEPRGENCHCAHKLRHAPSNAEKNCPHVPEEEIQLTETPTVTPQACTGAFQPHCKPLPFPPTRVLSTGKYQEKPRQSGWRMPGTLSKGAEALEAQPTLRGLLTS